MKFRELTHDSVNENFEMIAKGMSGDMVLVCVPATAAPTITALGLADVELPIMVELRTAAGELHAWYEGEVLLALTDAGSKGITITPAAGERKMSGGRLAVTMTMPKATYVAANTGVLTVSDPATAGSGICGWVVADATFTATPTA